MRRPAFPANLREFQRRFADEATCRQYLEACRWPDGFRCPRCGYGRAFPLRQWQRRECALLGLGTARSPTPGRLIRRARDLPQFPIKT